MKAVNIQWDFDNGEEAELPNEIDLPENLVDEDEISDYISDVTGFCHKGFEVWDESKWCCFACGTLFPTDDRMDFIPVEEINYCYHCGAKVKG